MTDIKRAGKILERIEELLRLGAPVTWIETTKSIKQELLISPAFAIRDILAMYGGIGSFNDIILYKNGQPLISENIEFDDLRTQLYQLCLQR